MKHAELLKDKEATNRGKQLIELFIDGLKELRKNAPTEDELFHDYDEQLEELIDSAVEQDMGETELAQFGKAVIELRSRQISIEEWRGRIELGTEEWVSAFRPVNDFLAEYAGKPLIAEETRENGRDILGLSFRAGRNPKRVGGYIIPQIIGNAQLYISARPNSGRASARLQVFDRIEADKYGSHLKIAIGD